MTQNWMMSPLFWNDIEHCVQRSKSSDKPRGDEIKCVTTSSTQAVFPKNSLTGDIPLLHVHRDQPRLDDYTCRVSGKPC